MLRRNRGLCVSKYDGEIRAVAEVSGDFDDLVAALGSAPGRSADRHDAMAHFLSGEEGWRDARKKLRGTFARPSPGAARSKRRAGEMKMLETSAFEGFARPLV